MAQDPQEAEEIAGICHAVLLNTGVPDREKFHACTLAGMRANELGIPVVLDPVGAGASRFRIQELDKLLTKVHFAVVRCNEEEARALLHIWNGKSGGVESGISAGPEEQMELAQKLSKACQCTAFVSGKEDAVSDGERTELLDGGNIRTARITGGGCMLSALCALLCGAGVPAFDAALTAGRLWRKSAGLAAERVNRTKGAGIGSYQAFLFDAVEVCFYRDRREFQPQKEDT